jgi:hypothetical protein
VPRQPRFPKRSLRFYDLEQRRHEKLDKTSVTAEEALKLTRYLIDTLGLWQPAVAFHPRTRSHWFEEMEDDQNVVGPFIVYAEQGIKVGVKGIKLTDIAHEVAHHWQFIETGDTYHRQELADLIDWTCAIIEDIVVQSKAL